MKPHNLIPMLAVAKDNLGLVQYLIGQLLATRTKKFAALQELHARGEGERLGTRSSPASAPR